MSDNPIVELTFVIPAPGQPEIIRDSFTRVDFGNEITKVYPDDIDPSGDLTTFTPEYPKAFYFWNMGGAYERAGIGTTPDFITADNWTDVVSLAPSGFITSVNSVMPKLMIPSKLLVKNGFGNLGDDKKAKELTNGTYNLFDWTVVKLAGSSTLTDEDKRCLTVAHDAISINQKDDTGDGEGGTSAELQLDEPTGAPTGEWEPTELVGEGAFCLLVNVVPTTAAKQAADDETKRWSVALSANELEIFLDSNGMRIKIGQEEERAQLVQAAAKEAPPQEAEFTEATMLYILIVYPVWNGVIVANGIQDIRNVVNVASQFCVKDRELSINDPTLQQRGAGGVTGTFDPENPADVFIKMPAGDKAKVLFGNEINAITKNCRFDMAYLPIYFSNAAVIDSFFIGSKDQAADPTAGILAVTYEYDVYPIWTNNDTDYNIAASDVETGKSIDVETEWKYARIAFDNDKPARRAGEMFGYILRTREQRGVNILTGNGSFNLSVGGSTLTGWPNYIKSVNVTVGLDGSSGQIVVDKYGLTSQTATPDQSIGAITIDVSNAPAGSVAGRIFAGLGMGVTDTQSSDGADFTIPLVGLEKKMEDIVLINVPFFDGKLFSEVSQFLTQYSGLIRNMAYAAGSRKLPSSDDIAAPLVDFKTGTTALDAMNQVMELTAHNYVIHKDGQIYFYALATDGLPIILGPDRSGDYPNTEVITIDRSPDFQDLRNERLILGLQKIEPSSRQVVEGAELPIFPLILWSREYGTDPYIPWSKPIVYGVPGYVTDEKLEDIDTQIQSLTKIYELTGRTSIPGDSRIMPYDRWGSYVIVSVSHNVDLQGKTWTTDLEFASGR